MRKALSKYVSFYKHHDSVYGKVEKQIGNRIWISDANIKYLKGAEQTSILRNNHIVNIDLNELYIDINNKRRYKKGTVIRPANYRSDSKMSVLCSVIDKADEQDVKDELKLLGFTQTSDDTFKCPFHPDYIEHGYAPDITARVMLVDNNIEIRMLV
jgi:mRNA-degrading endonuclease HigB of HigAB toxin-antitoxin module